MNINQNIDRILASAVNGLLTLYFGNYIGLFKFESRMDLGFL